MSIIGRPLNVNDFYKLHKQLDEVEKQVERDLNHPNTTNNTWRRTLEKLQVLKSKYDSLMADVEKYSCLPIADRISDYSNKDFEEEPSCGAQEKQLVPAQPKQFRTTTEPSKIDFGFFTRYTDITYRVAEFITNSGGSGKPRTLDFGECAAIFKKWHPGFRCDYEVAELLMQEIPLWHYMLSEDYFNRPEIGLPELIYAAYETQALFELLAQEGTNLRQYKHLTSMLKIVVNALNLKLSTRMDAYGETNFIPFVQDQLKLLKDEAKRLYWSGTQDSCGQLRVDLQRCLFKLKACQDLLKKRDGQGRTEIFKIQCKLLTTLKYLLPHFLQEQMRIKLEEARGLDDDSPEIQELKLLMENLDANTFHELASNFYMETDYVGSYGAPRLGSASFQQITYCEQTDLQIYKILPVSKEEAQWGAKVDPRLKTLARKLRVRELQNQMPPATLKTIQKYQQSLCTNFSPYRNLSAATRTAANQLGYDTNKFFLKFLQKNPICANGESKTLADIENSILLQEGISIEHRQLNLRITQEMVVFCFIKECFEDSTKGYQESSDYSRPYFPPSNETPPAPRSLMEPQGVFDHVYEQMNAVLSPESDFKEVFIEARFTWPIGVQGLDPKLDKKLRKLEDRCETFFCESINGFQPSNKNSLKEYLDEVRKVQFKSNLGNIGFLIKARYTSSTQEKPNEYHFGMSLHISPDSLTEINLVNPYSKKVHTFSSTQQMNDHLPSLLMDLPKGTPNGDKKIEVSFIPFCSNEEQYPLPPVAPIEESIASSNIEVIRFPCAYGKENKIAVRGNIPGILNWNGNTPLLERDGHYILEIPRGEYSKDCEYKFVLLIPGKGPVWENLPNGGNRKLSNPNQSSPRF